MGTKKTKVMFLALFLIFGFMAISYAEWINCSGPFPGTCTQGGCQNPESAEDCWLRKCAGNPSSNINCDKPKQV